MREAEALAEMTVESAVAGMGGPVVRGANSRAAIEVGRKREIEHRDVTRVIDHSRAFNSTKTAWCCRPVYRISWWTTTLGIAIRGDGRLAHRGQHAPDPTSVLEPTRWSSP